MSTPASREPDALRAADADRQVVAERLRRAQVEGRLDVFEYDERLRQAFTARTYGELARITADLPMEPSPPAVEPRERVSPVPGLRRSVQAWALASSVNLLIWAVLAVGSLDWPYPWWIWVAGPWGLVLLARATGRKEGPGCGAGLVAGSRQT